MIKTPVLSQGRESPGVPTIPAALCQPPHKAHTTKAGMRFSRGRQAMLSSETSQKGHQAWELPQAGHWITVSPSNSQWALTPAQSFHPWTPALRTHTVLQPGISTRWWAQWCWLGQELSHHRTAGFHLYQSYFHLEDLWDIQVRIKKNRYLKKLVCSTSIFKTRKHFQGAIFGIGPYKRVF